MISLLRLAILVITLQQTKQLAFPSDRLKNSMNPEKKRELTSRPNSIWDRRVFFSYDSTFTAEENATILQALNLIQRETCIIIREDSKQTHKDRIKLVKKGGCYSSVGKWGGVQEISLAEGCINGGAIIHEFLHSLGFIHSQMRPDRDLHVRINFDEIQASKLHNFKKEDPANVTIYSPYDLGSVMQYGPTAFSRSGGRTMIPAGNQQYLGTMGSQWLSFYDKLSLSKHYKCDQLCTKKIQCGVGYQNPNGCLICACPDTFAGPNCTQPWTSVQFLEATAAIQTKTIVVQPSDRNPYKGQGQAYYWIKGQKNRKVQIRIERSSGLVCSDSCPENSVEIKNNADQRMTGTRVCCPEHYKNPFISALMNTPIILRTYSYKTAFVLSYSTI